MQHLVAVFKTPLASDALSFEAARMIRLSNNGCLKEVRLCRGQGGDHMIAKDVTAPYVEGWDWILPVPDRNTGIWDRVELSYTGPVALQVSNKSEKDCMAYC